MHDVDDPKRAAAQAAEDRQRRYRPQDELEVEVLADGGGAVGLADRHAQDRVADHPAHDHVCAHGAVVVFLLLGLADAVLGYFEPVAEVAQGFVVARVDVELLGRHFQFDRITLARNGGTEVDVNDVVTFGPPRDVVSIAKGVNLERADVGGQKGKVLGRGGEHVPGVEVEEGHEEVEAYS